MNKKFIQSPPGLIYKNVYLSNNQKYNNNYINEIAISCAESVLNENNITSNLFNNKSNKKKKNKCKIKK